MSNDTPKQIDDVINVDRMDSLDRQKLDPKVKFQLLAAETKNRYQRDPRAGGFAFVARPRVWLQILLDLKVGPFTSEIRLHKPVVIGADNGDLIGWWNDVPLMVRCTVTDDNLHCLPLKKIPESIMPDRQTAGQLRIHAHNRSLELLREED